MQNDFGAFVIWGTGGGIEPMHASTMRSPRILREPWLHYFVITVAITSALPQPSSRRQDDVGSSPYQRANTTTIVCLTTPCAYTNSWRTSTHTCNRGSHVWHVPMYPGWTINHSKREFVVPHQRRSRVSDRVSVNCRDSSPTIFSRMRVSTLVTRMHRILTLHLHFSSIFFLHTFLIFSWKKEKKNCEKIQKRKYLATEIYHFSIWMFKYTAKSVTFFH